MDIIEKQYKSHPKTWVYQIVVVLIVIGLLIWSGSAVEINGGKMKGLQVAKNIILGILHPDKELLFNFTKTGVAYLLFETICIAFLGTIVGAILAIPFSFLAASNIVPRPIALLGRLFIMAVRTIPPFVYGLMFIRVTGPGPFAGLLTMSVCSIGMLTKMNIETIEDLDVRILESLDAAGCNTFEKIRYGIMPQLIPNFLSTAIYRFDMNLRDAAVLGLVGAGGIGAPLLFAMSSYKWNQVGSILTGLIILILENKLVTWEKNGNLNAGIEASLFKGRLGVTVEYYSRKTRDMLLSNPLAISSGFSGYDDNVGSMVNRGLELSLRGVPFELENFHWDATLMLSMNRNKVTALTSSQDVINYGNMVIEKGKPIYTFYMPKSAGVSPATGKQLYYAYYQYAIDKNGSTVTEKCDEYVTDNVALASLSKYYYGSRQALFSGSFSSNFVFFKNFDFSFLTTFSVGGKIYDGLYGGAMNVNYAGNNWHKNALRRWQKPGDVTDVPMIEIGGNRTAVGEDLIDASYFAIKNLTLGYTIPSKITDKAKMKSFRVFVTADNIALFCHLDGMDPQYNFSGSVSYTYTPSRVVAVGLDINF